MKNIGSTPPTIEPPLQVHQAARFGRNESIDAGGPHRFDLSIDHRPADLIVIDGEGTAETTAAIGLLQFDEFESLDRSKEPARRRSNAEFTASVAAVVPPHPRGKPGAKIDRSEFVDEKLTQFENRRTSGPDQLTEGVGDHRGARAGGSHDAL